MKYLSPIRIESQQGILQIKNFIYWNCSDTVKENVVLVVDYIDGLISGFSPGTASILLFDLPQSTTFLSLSVSFALAITLTGCAYAQVYV